MGNKGYNPRNDPANYRQGVYSPSGWANSGGGGGGVHGEYNRGYGGWQFDVSPWQTNMAQLAAQEWEGRRRNFKTSGTMGPHQLMFEEMKRDYQSKEAEQRRQQTKSHQADILGQMQQLGYMPSTQNVIPGGFFPGQQVQQMFRAAMGGGGGPQFASPMQAMASMFGGGGGYGNMFGGMGQQRQQRPQFDFGQFRNQFRERYEAGGY
ncbi:MAG: hypothetical protein GOVbin2833_35 [Prokaryotic dsDNA virus sp.]|nr:MAG: hypothetical protein GOVbin2833_35 [Prokaryotic dsDNA virus sp.]|tara:strand:- start:5632 stop:6252 length:621 start_codon:yes stop_codon:yes gene_type:complete